MPLPISLTSLVKLCCDNNVNDNPDKVVIPNNIEIMKITTIRSVEYSSNCSRVGWHKSFVKCTAINQVASDFVVAKNLKQGKPKFFGRTHKLEKSEKSNKNNIKDVSSTWSATNKAQICSTHKR